MMRSILRSSVSARPAAPVARTVVLTRSYAQDPNAKSDLRKVAQAASEIDITGSQKTTGEKVDQAARLVGAAKDTSPENPSVLSSAGAVGKQFNPDGAIGSIAQKVGGPFDKDGAIGSQFDAAKDGLAGQVEKAVDGPSQKKN